MINFASINTLSLEKLTTYIAPISYQSIWSIIAQNWATGDIFGTVSDNISGRFTSLIKGPTTGQVSIRLVSDDGSNLYIGISCI